MTRGPIPGGAIASPGFVVFEKHMNAERRVQNERPEKELAPAALFF
jgi:hypothetical protein